MDEQWLIAFPLLMFLSGNAGQVSSSSSYDVPSKWKQVFSSFRSLTLHSFQGIFVCFVVFLCAVIWSTFDYFSFLVTFTESRKATISLIMPARPSAWNNSAPTWRIFMKFDIWVFFGNLSRKFKFHQNLTRITGTLHEDWYTYMIIYRSFLLRMRNVSDKIWRENQNIHFILKNFFTENPVFYEIMWKNIVQPGRPQMTIWRMCIACWITKATNTHSGYVMLIASVL